jgi:uncharacterized protein (TIGR02246 family)
MTTTAPEPEASTDPTSDDLRAIEQVIADVELGFNSNDVELSTRHFRADARATSALGQRVVGLDAIVEAHRKGYAGPLRDSKASYDVDDVLFVRPDVAIVQKQAWEIDADGNRSGEGPAMVATYVMSRDEGAWSIVARANTLVVDGNRS